MALGEKRNGSVFATAAQRRDAAEYQVTSEPEIVPVVVDDTPQRTLSTDIGALGRAHNLFFTPSAEGRDFNSVLQEVQEYISGAYAALITEGGEDSKEQLMRYITKYLQDRRIAVAGMTQTELVDAIYSEMAEFGFLTRYIYADGIEEININSWRDIEVQYSDGRSEKLTEHFDSPEHALAVIRRMLHASGMVLDNASPLVTGHLTRNTRIAAMKSPVVDEDVGVAASIRIVNRHNLSREDLLRSGTATEKMLDWLSVFLRYGISICVAGATSSGKTTAAGWLLTTIPDSKRIFTIENGSRELELVREENGKVVNSVVHTLTRDSENERQRIDQIALVDICLRFNPDILVVGEMRGAEANAAQEAARVGVAVLTTIHSNSCEATYRRMVSLCKRAVDMSDETLLSYVTEAYPIVVFCKQLENKQRRMMEIMECEILPNGDRRYNTLFRYVITENHMEDGKFVIEGHHTQVNEISVSLRKRLLENGKVTNSVVHTLTRDSENERQRIDQIALVDICLRFNPDILVVGEMRGAEANAAQEAARVGVAVLTTIHSNSCEATYRRMVSLCKRAVDMSDETLLSYVTEAYPIVVFCKQLENKQRRMMEIMECEILPSGERRYNTLFRYVITENHMEDGKFVIEGHHTQVNEISVSLRKRLLENGMPNEELQALLETKKEVNAT